MEPAKAGALPLYEFFRAAGIQETAAAVYAKTAYDQSINEELALELVDTDWTELKLVLGDRRRVLNYVKSRKGGSSSRLPVEQATPPRPNDVPMILEADVKYNVDAPIGSGHFGLVYRGRYKEGEVAIKILLDVEVHYISSVRSAK